MVLRQRLAVLLVLLSAAGAVSEHWRHRRHRPPPRRDRRGDPALMTIWPWSRRSSGSTRAGGGDRPPRAPVSEVVLQRTVVTLVCARSGGEARPGSRPTTRPWSRAIPRAAPPAVDGLAAQAESMPWRAPAGGRAGGRDRPKEGERGAAVAARPGALCDSTSARLTLAAGGRAGRPRWEVELPAPTSPGARPAPSPSTKKVAAGRRTVRLVVPAGEAPVLEIQRRFGRQPRPFASSSPRVSS